MSFRTTCPKSDDYLTGVHGPTASEKTQSGEFAGEGKDRPGPASANPRLAVSWGFSSSGGYSSSGRDWALLLCRFCNCFFFAFPARYAFSLRRWVIPAISLCTLW
jgi:hypothetical protein